LSPGLSPSPQNDALTAWLDQCPLAVSAADRASILATIWAAKRLMVASYQGNTTPKR
jgi:hypothetical protein